jgi:putative membrane protein
MRVFVLLAVMIFAASSAQAQDKSSQKFLTEAIQGNYAEVEMGKLAQNNGQSQDVKTFGQTLISDHSAALERSLSVAQTMNVQAPNGPNAKQKADYDKMAKLKGAAFDKAFALHMVVDHKKDIGDYTKASKTNDAAGQYAKETLPKLQQHLELAQKIQK